MAQRNRSVSRVDEFPNFYKAAIGTSGADTLTFTSWDTGYSIKDGFGFILHRLIVRPDIASLNLLNAAGDRICVALVANNKLAALDVEQQISDSIIAGVVFANKLATAVGENVKDHQFVQDFTSEPGGGRLFAPKPLYWACYSAGAGAVIATYVTAVYTMIKLTQELYRELYESQNPSA